MATQVAPDPNLEVLLRTLAIAKDPQTRQQAAGSRHNRRAE